MFAPVFGINEVRSHFLLTFLDQAQAVVGQYPFVAALIQFRLVHPGCRKESRLHRIRIGRKPVSVRIRANSDGSVGFGEQPHHAVG